MQTKFAKSICAGAALLVVAATSCAQFLVLTPEPASADVVIRCVQAMGGAAAFASINSLRIHGRMSLGKDPFTAFTVTAKRPDHFRMELTVGPDHVTQGYDGIAGWQSVSGQHEQPAMALTGGSLAHLKDQAANAIGGPLVEMEKRGNQAELAGHATVDGADCFKLNVTLATGNRRAISVNSSSFLVVQEELLTVINGQTATIQQSVGDYRRFGQILVACLVVTRQKGQPDSQRIEIDKVEINPVVEESVFRRPR